MATMYHPIQSSPRNMGKYSKITTYTSVHSNNVSNGIDESALHYQVRTFAKDPKQKFSKCDNRV